MSRHWNPREVRVAESPRGWRRRAARPPRRTFGAAELTLTLFGGLLLGLGYLQAGVAVPDVPSAAAEEVAAHASIDVIDGDTFRLDGVTIRIADIDTPEVDGRCDAERAVAASATRRLEALLGEGAFSLEAGGDGRDEDRYGRKLRIVTRGGRSLGDVLVEEGLARPWTGRRLPWCAQV